MLNTLISSKTRLKLLLKFFLNPSSRSYLRGLESEFGESTNAIRLELNRFEDAGLLNAEAKGNKKMYGVNTQHPFFAPIQSMIRNYVGIDHLINNVLSKLGDVHSVYLTGDWARGIESNIIDIVIIADNINSTYLTNLTHKAEEVLNRKIRFVVYTIDEWKTNPLVNDEILLIYGEE